MATVDKSDKPNKDDKDDALIVVNGEEMQIDSRQVSYEQVVELAFPGLGADPNNIFSVLFRKVDQSNAQGSVVAGGTVKVHAKGSSFNVTRSIRS